MDSLGLSPVNFFCIKARISKAKLLKKQNHEKHLLPDTSSFCDETSFAKLAMAWNDDGLEFFATVQKPFETAFYPEITKGDSLELFIDTRNVKTKSFVSQFCHHFVFLPTRIDDIQAKEITRFRTEDRHELCMSKDLMCQTQFEKKTYSLSITIPRHCLTGYDPEQYRELGFTYRFNRPANPPQHFSVKTSEYSFEQYPSLWGSLELVS